MSDEDQMGELLAQMRRLTDAAEAGKFKARDADGGREAAARDGQAQVAAQLVEQTRAANEAAQAAQKAMIDEAVKAALSNIRIPSMAAQIGNGTATAQGRMVLSRGDAHPALKASFRDYQSGELLEALLDYKGIGLGGLDFEAAQRGKAKLDELGLLWAGVPSESKATLGETGAHGGYVLANNLVDTLVKPNTQEAVYTGANPLVTVINGVAVRGVDQPYRTGAPTRMTFQDWGSSKENLDEAYGSYTAYLGTVARIYDIGKQYARFSAGAAERDVVDELTKAAALAENFYVMAGAGTGVATPGVNDPTVGIYTALNGSIYDSAFVGASNSTVAGSVAAMLAAAHGRMAQRSRHPSAAVLDAVTYWNLFSQGSDTAGFWMSALLGAGFRVGADGQSLSWNGTPIHYDANLTTNTAAKIAILAEWKAFKFYRGMEFRIDTSDVAGDRWDKNLIGFRGEEEFGFNAYTGVTVGAAELVTAVIP